MQICMQAVSTHTDASKNVSRETFSLMSEYVALLLKWNSKINLIGPQTEAEIWTRHIEDCRQLVKLIPSDAKTIADFGSGGGLPGLIIAIERPDLVITLIEQDQRKAAFLLEVKHRLGLDNVIICAIDIAALNGTYDLIMARALASLNELLSMAQPHLHKASLCLFPKGANHTAEIAQARADWQFELQQITSITNENSSILLISTLQKK